MGNHKDTPQPGDKQGWFKDDNDAWDRPWDEEDRFAFYCYMEAFSNNNRQDLIDLFSGELEVGNPDTILNRMAARLAKIVGDRSDAKHKSDR